MIRIKSKKNINLIVNDSERYEQFLKKINFSDNCWNWNGTMASTGYGKFFVGVLDVAAHRASFVFHKGKINEGNVIMHSCDNRKCVNPWHLSQGSNADNSRDMKNKKRQAYGERNAFSKLSEKDVIQIKNLLKTGKGSTEIAKLFNVYKTCIHKIKIGESWAHIRES